MPTDWMREINNEVTTQRRTELLIVKIIKYIREMKSIDETNYQKRIERDEQGRRCGFVKVGHYIIGIGAGYTEIVIADERNEDDVYNIDKHTACGLLNLIKEQKAIILGGMMYEAE